MAGGDDLIIAGWRHDGAGRRMLRAVTEDGALAGDTVRIGDRVRAADGVEEFVIDGGIVTSAHVPRAPQLDGAVGNDVTDDTAAILASLNAVGAGGHVYGPAARYRIGDLVVPSEGQTFEGAQFGLDGVGAAVGTVLRAKTGAVYLLKIQGKRWTNLRGLTLDGTSPAGVMRTSKGLLLESSASFSTQGTGLTDVTAWRCLTGMEILNTGLTQADTNTLIRFKAMECGKGLRLATPNSQETVLINADFSSNLVENIEIAAGALTMLGGHVQGVRGVTAPAGIKFTAFQNILWVNLRDVIFEGQNTDIDGAAAWPEDGVVCEHVVLQGDVANVVMGAANGVFVARNCRFNIGGGVGPGGGKIKMNATGCSVTIESSNAGWPDIECNATGCSVLLINQRVAPTFSGSQTPEVTWIDNGKVSFGTAKDTNVYRGAANVLQSDDPIKTVGDNVWIANDAGGGLYFGVTPDTRLFRGSANVLKSLGQMWADLRTSATSVTTARTGGAAAALPANPVRYIAMLDEAGNRVYVPAYS